MVPNLIQMHLKLDNILVKQISPIWQVKWVNCRLSYVSFIFIPKIQKQLEIQHFTS